MKEEKGLYVFLAILLAIILVLNLLLIIIMPALVVVEIIAGLCEYFTVRKIKRINKKNELIKQQEIILLKKGYKKINDNLYMDEKNKKLNISGKEYGFSQIVDCELIENKNSISNTYGNTNGKIKSNGKIKATTNVLSTNIDYCNELYLHITVNDFENPNIRLDIKSTGKLNTNSSKYKNVIGKANEILSLFKLIISKNKESYIETGTITKIEHRYITEEDASIQIERLSKLYEDGILTDYEFEIKKKELLNKVK